MLVAELTLSFGLEQPKHDGQSIQLLLDEDDSLALLFCSATPSERPSRVAPIRPRVAAKARREPHLLEQSHHREARDVLEWQPPRQGPRLPAWIKADYAVGGLYKYATV